MGIDISELIKIDPSFIIEYYDHSNKEEVNQIYEEAIKRSHNDDIKYLINWDTIYPDQFDLFCQKYPLKLNQYIPKKHIKYNDELQKNPLIYKESPLHIKDDYNYTLKAVKSVGSLLKHSSLRLKRNYNIVKEAVCTDGHAFTLIDPYDFEYNHFFKLCQFVVYSSRPNYWIIANSKRKIDINDLSKLKWIAIQSCLENIRDIIDENDPYSQENEDLLNYFISNSKKEKLHFIKTILLKYPKILLKLIKEDKINIFTLNEENVCFEAWYYMYENNKDIINDMPYKFKKVFEEK